jgi:glycosyltransferase involved in cell wall biosynthesis
MQASVLVPTKNRRDSLLRTLRALREQSVSAESFEIVVSFDRCTDGSAEAVAVEFPEVRRTQPTNPGQSAALNAAARLATAPLLIFLDDDMKPEPGFIAAHIAAHRDMLGPIVVAGRTTSVVVTQSAFSEELDAHYRAFDTDLARGELASSPVGLSGGNMSIKADDFWAVGGIDERYVFMKWDFELTARFLEGGFRLIHAREAAATTFLQLDEREMLSRASQNAESDIRIAREHPWCLPYLTLHRCATRDDLRAVVLWHAAGAIQWVTAAVRRVLPANPMLTRGEMVARYWNELRRQLRTRAALRAFAHRAAEPMGARRPVAKMSVP